MATKRTKAGFLAPMLLLGTEKLPDGGDWREAWARQQELPLPKNSR